MTIKELRQKRKELVEKARAIYAKVEDEKRSALTTEEDTEFRRLTDESKALGKRADDLEILEKLEVVDGDPEPRSQADPVDDEPEKRAKKDEPSDEEKRALAAFGAYLCPDRVDDREELRDLQADVDIKGGYAVGPPTFLARLIKEIDEVTFVRQLADVQPVTSGDELRGVSLDADVEDFDWTPEVGAVQKDDAMKLGGRSLKPNQLSKRILVSEKFLVVSGIPPEDLVRTRLAYKYGLTQEKHFLTGTGNGQPLGIFTPSPQGISTGRDVSTGNTQTSVTYDGWINARGALKQGHRANAVVVAHRDFETQVLLLKDGEGRPLWQPSVQAGAPDRLANFPLRLSEFAPNTFTAGLYVAALCDFRYYMIAELTSYMVKRLGELYAETGQVGFIGKGWVDGMPVLESGFVRMKLAP